MFRPLAVLCLLAASSHILQAQTVPAGDAPVTTLRTQVRLTTLDVVVTDGKGNPVHDLKQEDFSVQESKAAQRITSFEEHRAGTTTYEKPKPGTFTNATAARGGVSNVLLIDWLNTPATDRAYMRDQLVKFVAAQPAGTRTAIFTLSSTIHLLQDFTADPAVLKAALVNMGMKYSPLVGSANFGTDPVVSQMVDVYRMMLTQPGGAAVAQDMIAKITTLNDNIVNENAQVTRNSALITMEGLSDVARYLSGVNGRKNLFWVSGSFPVYIQRDDENTGSPFKGNVSMEREFEDTVNLLATNQVAVYPVDPRGVPVPPSQNMGEISSPHRRWDKAHCNNSTSLSPEDKAYSTSQFQEHTAMNELADNTGGKAFYNTNDINGALRQAEDLGSQYYTLSYTPPLATKAGSSAISTSR